MAELALFDKDVESVECPPTPLPFFYHKYGLKIISKEEEVLHYSTVGDGGGWGIKLKG